LPAGGSSIKLHTPLILQHQQSLLEQVEPNAFSLVSWIYQNHSDPGEMIAVSEGGDRTDDIFFVINTHLAAFRL
jgi:hypothetical protein